MYWMVITASLQGQSLCLILNAKKTTKIQRCCHTACSDPDCESQYLGDWARICLLKVFSRMNFHFSLWAVWRLINVAVSKQHFYFPHLNISVFSVKHWKGTGACVSAALKGWPVSDMLSHHNQVCSSPPLWKVSWLVLPQHRSLGTFSTHQDHTCAAGCHWHG